MQSRVRELFLDFVSIKKIVVHFICNLKPPDRKSFVMVEIQVYCVTSSLVRKSL